MVIIHFNKNGSSKLSRIAVWLSVIASLLSIIVAILTLMQLLILGEDYSSPQLSIQSIQHNKRSPILKFITSTIIYLAATSRKNGGSSLILKKGHTYIIISSKFTRLIFSMGNFICSKYL